jgi:UDP-GlcNAc:undecaprenyl-phosphate GlcNAc-1-phosphate transferase
MIPLQTTDLIWYGLSFLTAAALVVYVTPLTIRVANTFKIHDTPDGRLKKHEAPIPYLGGLAVAAAFVITFSLLSTSESIDYRALGILAGGFMMLLLGLYDDLINLSPAVKFLGQLLATVALYKSGVRIEIAALDNWTNLALTILWVTGITNAFNLIDVMDGLTAGVACMASLFLFVISATLGNDEVVPFMAIVMAGTLVGFLRFNIAPARIFLGDTGSLFIGFMLGALTMLVSYSPNNRLAVVTPVVLLAVPIFDTVFVAVQRFRKGIPFFRGSPDHFALRLAHSGLGVHDTVAAIFRVCIGLGMIALLLVFGPASWAPWALAFVAASGAVAMVWLGRLPAPHAGEPAADTETPSPPSSP